MKRILSCVLTLFMSAFVTLGCQKPVPPEVDPVVEPEDDPVEEAGPLCSITGTVWDALGLKGAEGIKVSIGDSTATTDESGVYVIAGYPIKSEDLTVKLFLEDRTAEYALLPEEMVADTTISVPAFYSGYEERDGAKIQKVGDMWSIIPEETFAKMKGAVQGLAFDGDYMFIFHDLGDYACFSLSGMRYLYGGDVDPENQYNLHCNEAFFSKDSLSSGSEHPLLYTSECRSLFNVYIYDITSEGSKLVGTLDPPDGMGMFQELLYGISSYSYDAENGWLYGHNNGFIRRYRFPSFSEYTDGSYKMQASDFLGEMIFEPALTTPQGACAHDGKLIMPSGIYTVNQCCIYIYDFETREVKIVDINDLGLEPEGIDYKDGWYYVAFNKSHKEVVYRFQF